MTTALKTKEKPAHTPGPWKVCMHMESDDLVVRSNDIYQDIVANRQCDSYSLTNQIGAAAEREANARLIAAAPDMTALLAKLREMLATNAKVDWGVQDAAEEFKAMLEFIDNK